MNGVQHIAVTPEESGQKLLQFLQRRLGKDVPKAAVMRWIRTGQVRVNKGRAKPFDRIAEGDVVRVPPFHSEEPEAAPVTSACPHPDMRPGPVSAAGTPSPAHATRLEQAGLSVAAQAEGLLVLHKPAGLPVQPGTGHADAVTSRLAHCFAGAPFMPTPAHRLDKDTSGLLLVATSYARLQSLHALFRNEHAIGKFYLAWVQGDWPENAPVTLKDTLGKRDTAKGERVLRLSPDQNNAGANDGPSAQASCSVTPILRRDNATLLAVRLHTGRTHQIRVQLAGRGFPILGDRKYGGPACTQGMLLHAWRIVLPASSDSQTSGSETLAFTCLPDWKSPFDVPPAPLTSAGL